MVQRAGGAMSATVLCDLTPYELRLVDQVAEFWRRKVAEDALSQTQQRLQTVIANSPVVLFSYDHDGKLVFAEGKGLRQLTRDTCSLVARLDMPGEIKSLNVSNAAALSLYIGASRLGLMKG